MNCCYQIEKSYGSCVRPKATILVRKHLDGLVTAWYKNEKLSVCLLDKKPQKPEIEVRHKPQGLSAHQAGRIGKRRSPWGQYNPNWLKQKKTGTGR